MEDIFYEKLIDEKPSKELFFELLEEYYYMKGSGEDSESYEDVINYKTKNIIKEVSGVDKPIIKLPEISEEEYSDLMYETYKKYVETKTDYMGDVMKQKDIDYKCIKEGLSKIEVNEIIKNKIDKDINFQDKKFVAGTRAIKVIQKMISKIEDYQGEKIRGSLKLDPSMRTDVYLSIKPEAFIAGGEFGDSCLSQSGENEGSLLIYPSVSYMAVLHTADFSWRAWLLIDTKEKLFSIPKGYPRENYYAQILAYKYFKDMGYTFVPPFSFRGSFYLEAGVGLVGHFSTFSVISKKIYEEKYMEYDLIYGKKIRSSDFKNAQAAICDGCEEIFIGEASFDEGLCRLCEDRLEEDY